MIDMEMTISWQLSAMTKTVPLLASTLGNGFIVPGGYQAAATRKGKQVMNVAMPLARLCLPRS
ncbi:MAG: hypothetical protein R3D29_08095 [Nitratireductor sp.]